MLLVPLISLAALVAAAIASRITRSPVAAVLLALASGVWLVANSRLEGPVLISLTPRNGLTTTDLLGFIGFFYSLHIVWERKPASARTRAHTWALSTLCTVVFVAWPLGKLLISFIWPNLFHQIQVSWIGRLVA